MSSLQNMTQNRLPIVLDHTYRSLLIFLTDLWNGNNWCMLQWPLNHSKIKQKTFKTRTWDSLPFPSFFFVFNWFYVYGNRSKMQPLVRWLSEQEVVEGCVAPSPKQNRGRWRLQPPWRLTLGVKSLNWTNGRSLMLHPSGLYILF